MMFNSEVEHKETKIDLLIYNGYFFQKLINFIKQKRSRQFHLDLFFIYNYFR